MTRALTVAEPGPLTTVQDLGRTGWAHLGVSRSGAADRRSLRLANRLVGNPEGAAALESTLGGLVLHAEGDLLLAVTGLSAEVTVDGRPVAMNAPFEVGDGGVLRLRAGSVGLRAYVAVRGGVAVAEVLGSRSTDVLGGLGPAPLAPGDVLPVGASSPVDLPTVDVAPVGPVVPSDVRLHVLPGPRADWFEPAALQALLSEPFRVSPDSNRVALRLAGPSLPRRTSDELPSEGLIRGAIQVPPSGQPVLFLVDHPVTGGYPVLAVVIDEDADIAGQLRPGSTVHFAPALRGKGGRR